MPGAIFDLTDRPRMLALQNCSRFYFCSVRVVMKTFALALVAISILFGGTQSQKRRRPAATPSPLRPAPPNSVHLKAIHLKSVRLKSIHLK